MFYPDLEENSSRGIKSGAISKYQRNVGLYPAAFALLVNFFNQVINLFCFMQTYHSSGILFCDCGEKLDTKTYRRSQSQKRYSGKRETAPKKLLFDEFEVFDALLGLDTQHINAARQFGDIDS